MTVAQVAPPRRPWWTRLVPGGSSSAAFLHIVERNALAWRGLPLLFLSNILEPAFFLLSIGVGLGAMVGDVTLPSGTTVPFQVFYAACFELTMLVMGLIGSWWALLVVPTAGLISFAFASAGLAASTFMRSFVDFDWVNVALLPLFLFSTIFFPLSRYPESLQWVVQSTPLYQGVVLQRSLVVGEVNAWLVVPVLYLVLMGTICLRIASGRMQAMLQP
jgi:hypothetical protein